MTTLLGSLDVDRRLLRVNKRQTRCSDVAKKLRHNSSDVEFFSGFYTENKRASMPCRRNVNLRHK